MPPNPFGSMFGPGDLALSVGLALTLVLVGGGMLAFALWASDELVVDGRETRASVVESALSASGGATAARVVWGTLGALALVTGLVVLLAVVLVAGLVTAV